MSTGSESNLALVETPADAYRESDGSTIARAVDRLGSYPAGRATEKVRSEI